MFEENYYKKKLTEYGKDDARSLGWGSEQSQTTRFKVLSEIGIKSGDSILDVGCGFGDFRKYLISKDVKIKYTGIDTNQDFIEIVQRENPPLTVFCENVLFHWRRDIEYDWVVASGLFCFDEPEWEKNVFEKIKHMFLCCKKGVAINFLSSSFLKKEQLGFKHCYPEEVIKTIRKLSIPFSLRHDYVDNDFTVYLFKREKR